MRKGVLLGLLVGIFMIGAVGIVSAEDINLALESNGGVSSFNVLTQNNVRDWNNAAYINNGLAADFNSVGLGCASGEILNYGGTYEAIVDFPSPVSLNRVRAVVGGNCRCKPCSVTSKLHVKIGGVWNEIHSFGYFNPLTAQEKYGNWENVEAVKFTSAAPDANLTASCETTPADSELYELLAFNEDRPALVIPISSCEELQAMKNELNDDYYLTKNIDCSATNPADPDNAGSIWDNGGLGFEPVGSCEGSCWSIEDNDFKFEGNFDGRGFEITDLYINRPTEKNVGLFGAVGPVSELKNVDLVNFDITGYMYTGSFVGVVTGSKISGVTATGNILVNRSGAGGLIGINNYGGRIFSSSFRGNVSCFGENVGFVGGLVGSMANIENALIDNSFAEGNVHCSGSLIGGLVGSGGYNISNSYFSGNVSGISIVGGLVGNGAFIYNSSSSGNVFGVNHVGGLAGGGGYISNSYSTASVTGLEWTDDGHSMRYPVGGLVGAVNGPISNSFSAGNVTGFFGDYTGGLVGEVYFDWVCEDSFWDSQRSGYETSACGTPKTTVEMIDILTFNPPWDFDSIWKIEENTYPCFQWYDHCFEAIIFNPMANWTDANGDIISEADFEDTVGLYIFNSGLPEGVEVDFAISYDEDDIRTVNGVVDGAGNAIASWTITEVDLDKAKGNFDEFVFSALGLESGNLKVLLDPNDSPMNITIVEPACGEHFNESETVRIVVDARDNDSRLWGNVTIDGIVNATFENGGVDFYYTFDSPGTYQVVAEAVNDDNKRARHIANVIILEMDSGAYVERKYVAACIFEPKDFGDMDESNIHFNASTTRGVEIIDGVPTPVTPEDSPNRFNWVWTFFFDDGTKSDGPENDYEFWADFPPGDNSASLRVVFD